MSSRFSLYLGLVISTLLFPREAVAFQFENAIIPVEEIRSGGPPKDGIPALLNPKFVNTEEAVFLKDTDRVIGMVVNKDVKAYPIRILNWHEIVNDEINGKKIIVSFCPLCGTAMVFESQIEGKLYTFGVSGLLYNSDVLMYDHQTESLWSQIKMKAVTGAMAGTSLKLMASEVTTWKDWKTRYPRSQVLSIKTGYSRDYENNPYANYENSQRLYFPVDVSDKRRKNKDWVFGILLNGVAKAYPYDELAKEKGPLKDNLGNQTIFIHFDKGNRSVRAETSTGKPVPGVSAYWFAWQAFYPKTQLFEN